MAFSVSILGPKWRRRFKRYTSMRIRRRPFDEHRLSDCSVDAFMAAIDGHVLVTEYFVTSVIPPILDVVE